MAMGYHPAIAAGNRPVVTAVLGDSEAVEQLAEAHRAYVEDDVVRGVEAVRALRPS